MLITEHTSVGQAMRAKGEKVREVLRDILMVGYVYHTLTVYQLWYVVYEAKQPAKLPRLLEALNKLPDIPNVKPCPYYHDRANIAPLKKCYGACDLMI
jgi:hypothetical protein